MQTSSGPAIGGAGGSSGSEPAVAAWLKAALDAEIERIASSGTARPVAVPVLNMGVVVERIAAADAKAAAAAKGVKGGAREARRLVNRVEVGTAFDFERVIQIMLSPARACEAKPGYQYVNVVLVTSSPVLLILPYLYDRAAQADNDLHHWLFVNNKGQRARHEVRALEDVASSGRGL
jgi:hypothetical protein